MIGITSWWGGWGRLSCGWWVVSVFRICCRFGIFFCTAVGLLGNSEIAEFAFDDGLGDRNVLLLVEVFDAESFSAFLWPGLASGSRSRLVIGGETYDLVFFEGAMLG